MHRIRTWTILGLSVILSAALLGSLVFAAPGNGTLFGTDASGGNLLVIDRTTGAGTVVGPMGVGAVPALTVDLPVSGAGVMYVATGAGAAFLYTVDPTTASATFVGDTGLEFAAVGAMDFRADGTLYAAVNIVGDGGTGSDHLATINKATGEATIIGPFGDCSDDPCTIEGMEAIAFDRSGTLWGAHSARGVAGLPGLYTIDPATGTATFVAPILDASGSPPSGGVVSLQFACDGTLYGGTATAMSPATDGGRLATINPTTGLFSFVGAVSATTGGRSLGALAFGTTLCPDHYLSYKIKPSKGSPKFQPIVAIPLRDQFEDGLFDVTKPLRLYNPADKNDEGIPEPLAHLEGYQIKLTKQKPPQPKHVPRTVQVTNQFPQTLLLTTIKPDRLLVPTTKCIDQPGTPCPNPLPPPDPATADHFKCYTIKITKGTPKFQPILGVSVGDQFTAPKLFNLNKLSRLCNPVDKRDEGLKDPSRHLMCYQATLLKGQPKHVPVKGAHLSNQFGIEQVDTVKEAELCVPSLKQDLGPLQVESAEGEEVDGDDDED